jgi:hypothetical protein
VDLKPWTDYQHGLNAIRIVKGQNYNNVLYSAEYMLGLHAINDVSYDTTFLKHIGATDTEYGGYAPKNSHDNITGKLCGLLALTRRGNAQARTYLVKMQPERLSEGKHPRDSIFYGFMLNKGYKRLLWAMLMPFVLFEIIRAILSRGRVRPEPWVGPKLRLHALFNQSLGTERLHNGYAKHYKHGKIEYTINDGKFLSLLRLHALKNYLLMKPFVYLCKKLYTMKYGKRFQSEMFSLYFVEKNHPVRVLYWALDDLGITILD